MYGGELIISQVQRDRNIYMQPIIQKGLHQSSGKILRGKISGILKEAVQREIALKEEN